MNLKIEQFESWLENKNLKKVTVENYIYYFNKFVVYDRYNQESVSRFLTDKANRNSVARGFLVNLKKFLMRNRIELLISDEYYKEIIESELPQWSGRPKQRLVKPIPHEHIKRLERALEDERLKLMLLVTYYGALRLGELLKIRIMSFDWEAWGKDQSKMGEVRVYGKGDKEGIALLPSFLMKRIAKYIRSNEYKATDTNDYLFIKERKQGSTDMNNKGRYWEKKIRQAGIDCGLTQLDSTGEPIEGTRVYPHRLRHSYAGHLLKDLKCNMREVQEILRHSSIKSTQIYTLIDKEDLKRRLDNQEELI